MPKQIIIAEQHRIGAVFGEDQIQELVVATGQHQVSDIYLGIVENVLPGIDAAFINIGEPSRNGFIHVTDLGPLRLKRGSGSITELLAPQQKVLVQIMKEPTGNKGPRLTGNISLPGRYVVLIPFGKGVNLSRRIRSEGERNRLRAVAVLAKPAGMGMLVRTEAEGTTEDAILEDLEILQKQWEAVQQDANTTRAPALLNRDDDFIQRVLRDMYAADVNRIVVDSLQGLKRVKQTLAGWNDNQIPPGVVIDQHRERQPILEYFRVNAAIRESLKPRVDLPSGGYIIIEPTEALTVIDVNSGSFTKSNTSRETVRWTNYEAATEIARQMRLRNIAGVIIIDFIDMDYRKDQLEVLEHFNKQLRVDKARPQIAQLSELGLVELTRKRQGQNIYELFGETCATCGGLGHLAHVPGEAVYGADGEAIAVSLVSNSSAREYRSRSTSETTPTVGKSRSISRRNTRTTPDSRQPATDTWDSFESEGSESDEDFNLVNHPSYQEQNGVNKKRRRRLGRTDREEVVRILPKPTIAADLNRSPVINGEPIRVVGRNTPPEPRQNPDPAFVTSVSFPQQKEQRDNAPIPSSRLAPPTIDNSKATLISSKFAPTELEAFISDPPPADFYDDETTRVEKPVRVKPVRPTIEPPEVVSIEMSELEKETYAWMGISPLVKTGRELKNPKTAIVKIVPLGTLPPEELVITVDVDIEAQVTPELESTTETDTIEIVEPVESIVETIEEAIFNPPIIETIEEEVVVITPPITEIIEEPTNIIETVTEEPSVEISVPTVEAVEEVPEIRRRKRRSSAAE